MTVIPLGDYYYDDRHLIGKGAFSHIYKGFRTVDHAVVAIKKVHRVVNMKYFHNEVELMKSISHPNIVQLYDIFQQNNYVFMIMEYCNGGDLSRYIEKKTSKYDQRYFHQILLAFEYLNQKGIIHRDIKPQNVLIHKHTVKITDFGFAKSLEKAEDLHSTFCGSPLYMSPEILRRQNYSAQSDLWSLGVLLYELMVKEHPYLVHTTQQLMNFVENGYPIQFDAIRSTYYRKIIGKLLEPEVSRRIPSEVFFRELRQNDEFLEELDDMESGKPFSIKEFVNDIKSTPSQPITIATSPPPCDIPLTSPVIPKSIFRTAAISPTLPESIPRATERTSQLSTCLSIMRSGGKESEPAQVTSSIPSQSVTPIPVTVRKTSDTDLFAYYPPLQTASHSPSISPKLFPCSAPSVPSIPANIEQHIVNNYVDERERLSETTYVMPVYGSSPPIKPQGIGGILTKSVRSLSAVWNMSPLSGLSTNFKL